MSRRSVFSPWALVSALVFVLPAWWAPPADAEKPARTDTAGDPLPAGALARLGTARYRPAARVDSLTFSPDGTLLASTSADKVLSVWDASTGRERRRIVDPRSLLTDIRFSEDGRTVRAAEHDGVRAWDVATGEERQHLGGQPLPSLPVAFAPDGKLFAMGAGRFQDASIRLWDAAGNKELRRLEGHRDRVRSLAFSPDGKVLASGGADHTLRLWDTAEGKELQKLVGHDGGVRLIVFAPDGKTVVSAGDEGTVRAWDVATGKNNWTYRIHLGGGRSLAFSPDGQSVVLGEVGGSVEFLATATGQSTAKWRAEPVMVVALALSPDGKQVATAGLDGPIHVWDAAGKEVSKPEGHQLPIARLGCTPDGKVLLTSGTDGTVRAWDATSGKERWRLDGIGILGDAGKFVAFAPDGQTLITRKQDRVIRVFDATNGQELRPLLKKEGGEREQPTDVLFAPDGKTLALADPNGVSLCDPSTGAELRRVRDRYFHGTRMVFSPDSRFLVMEGFTAGVLREVEVSTGRVVGSIKVGGPLYTSLTFAPDGRTLGCCAPVLVELWEVASGKLRADLGGPRDSPRAVAFAPDGRLLVEGDEDRRLRFWDLATGKVVYQMDHPGAVTNLLFLPGGQAFVSGSSDGTALVWDLKEARARLTPVMAELTATERDALWKDLAGADALKAYQAELRLSAGGAPVVEMLGERLASLGPTEKQPAKRVTAGRILEVLEHMGTPEARGLLEKLAKESTDTRVAEEAKAALERLGK